MLRNVIDRIRTTHPSAKIETKDDVMEVSFAAEKVVVKTDGNRAGIGPSLESLTWFSRREFENEVVDRVMQLWWKHEATLPKRPSSGGSSSYSGRGGGDELASAEGYFIDHGDSDGGSDDGDDD